MDNRYQNETLRRYEEHRKQTEEHNIQKVEASEELYYEQVISDYKQSHEAEKLIKGSMEELADYLENVSSEVSLEDLPRIKNLIQDIANLTRSIDRVSQEFHEDLSIHLRNLLDRIVMELNAALVSLGIEGRYQEWPLLGSIYYRAIQLTTFIVTTVETGIIYADSSRKQLDFHYWLKDELLKRRMLHDEISNLEQMGTKQLPHDLGDLEAIEKKLWAMAPFQTDVLRTDDEIHHLPVKAYRKMLMDIFEKILNSKELIAGSKEKAFFDEYGSSLQNNNNNVMALLAALEKERLQKKLKDCEKIISTRLIARLPSKHHESSPDQKVIDLLLKYAPRSSIILSQSDKAETFSTAVTAMLSFGDDRFTENEKTKAQEKETEIVNALQEKAKKDKTNLYSNLLLVIAGTLALALAITVFVSLAVTGLGPIIISLAVGAFACAYLAYRLNPELFIKFDSDISLHMAGIMERYDRSTTKNKIREAARKKKAGLFQEAPDESEVHEGKNEKHGYSKKS